MLERIRQFREADARPTEADFALGRSLLATALFELFRTQHPRDIVHAVRTARWLQERGHSDPDLLMAALLHDIGKGEQRRWDRVGYVLASALGVAPRVGSSASRIAARRAVARGVNHSVVGGQALSEAGAPARVVDLTVMHHRPAGADRMLALLQQADAAN